MFCNLQKTRKVWTIDKHTNRHKKAFIFTQSSAAANEGDEEYEAAANDDHPCRDLEDNAVKDVADVDLVNENPNSYAYDSTG